MKNCIDYLDEVARGFVATIESQPGVQKIPTDDYGWENHRYRSDLFRLAHVEIFNQERFLVIHCCVFPHENDPSPIFGFDVIAGENKVTGLFMDLSPVTHDDPPPFSHIRPAAPRELPEWGGIFSGNVIACRPDRPELEEICGMAGQLLARYLTELGRRSVSNEIVQQMQDRYCLQQRRNPHTTRAIVNLLGEARAREFITQVLSPTNVSTMAASYRNQAYPALMSREDVEVLARLAAGIPTNGIAVEVGSALGGSAKVMLDANPGIGMLHLIDSDWACRDHPLDHELLLYHRHVIDLHEIFPLYEFRNSREFACWYLRDYGNVTMHGCNSPYDLADWTEPVDFVYEDSSHDNPQLRDNLVFWWERLKPGGMICGHDYAKNCRDVDATVNELATRWGVDLRHESAVWWVSKPA